MENSVKLLLSYLSNGQDNRYSKSDLENVFRDFFKTIENLNLVQKSQPLKEILCPICDTPHYVKVVDDNVNFYVSCELTGIMEKVDKQSLNGYKFSPNTFAKWVASEIKLTDSVEQFENIVWYLGQTVGGKPDFKIYLICTDDFNVAVNKYNSSSNVYLWLGEIPYNKSVSKNLISMKDLLFTKENGLEIDKRPFNVLTGLNIKNTEEIVLRIDVAIRKEEDAHFLLLGRNESLQNFNHKESISPKSYELLKFAGQPKVLKTGFRLGDAVEADIAENKRTISKYIKELNTKCLGKETPKILSKSDNTHWKLDSPSMVNGSK